MQYWYIHIFWNVHNAPCKFKVPVKVNAVCDGKGSSSRRFCYFHVMDTNSCVVFHSGFDMEYPEVHESQSSKSIDDTILERNGEISVIPTSVPEFKSTWKREVVKRNRGLRVQKQRSVRSHSLPSRQLNRYSVGEIRRIRERLLRTQRHPEPGRVKQFTRTQKLALSSLALVDFISFCSMSIMAPFFPRQVCYVWSFHWSVACFHSWRYCICVLFQTKMLCF